MGQPLRLFIAIDLPAPLKDELEDLQARLRSDLGPAAWAARWVDPAGTHLTLAFLGNVDAGRVDEIDAALRAPAESSQPFGLQTDAIGAFPSAHRPRLLWLGLAGDLRRLEHLQDRVATALARIGFPRERRRFSPHLTLARIRESARPGDLVDYGRLIERGTDPPHFPVPVHEVVLFQSQLSPTGAIYSRLASRLLGEGANGGRVIESEGHDDVHG